jgi:hypothetical protein
MVLLGHFRTGSMSKSTDSRELPYTGEKNVSYRTTELLHMYGRLFIYNLNIYDVKIFKSVNYCIYIYNRIFQTNRDHRQRNNRTKGTLKPQ